MAFLFAMVLEAVVVELLMRALDAPEGLRAVVLVVDLYSILIVVAIIAACVTRPHVLSDNELRIRCGAFLDLRVPREQISSLRVARNYNETGMVRVRDGRLSVAVAGQTNVVVELREPIQVVRPLGGRAEVGTIRFFADERRRSARPSRPADDEAGEAGGGRGEDGQEPAGVVVPVPAEDGDQGGDADDRADLPRHRDDRRPGGERRRGQRRHGRADQGRQRHPDPDAGQQHAGQHPGGVAVRHPPHPPADAAANTAQPPPPRARRRNGGRAARRRGRGRAPSAGRA